MLILAHRPFAKTGPFAETGPIFLCAKACMRHESGVPLPYTHPRARLLVKGYWLSDRIGRGADRHGWRLEDAGAEILANEGTAYAHVRSAFITCCQFRVERA
jgi:hypothetical protein